MRYGKRASSYPYMEERGTLNRKYRAHFDWPLLLAVYALSLFGIYCISSATFDPDKGIDVSILNHILNSRSSMWQSIFVLVSPVVIAVVMAIPMELYKNRVGKLIYYGVLALLVITFLSSTLVNGIRAWLDTGMGRSIQPAEFCKISILIALASVLSRSKKPMSTTREFMRVVMVVGIPALIVLAQGETGSVIVVAAMTLCMMYFAGVNLKLIIVLISIAALGIAAIIIYAVVTNSADYRILRILAFSNPQLYSQSGGYQLLQAQKAIGSGQITGLGMFRLGTVTQLGNVPENSTDFIFTTICEGFGFVGAMCVMAVYLFIILRMLYLARTTEDRFGRLIIVGVMGMLAFHVFENISMNLGLMPITGIPLPFLSYGGSNYITNIIGIALVLNVTRSKNMMANSEDSFT